MYPTDISRRKQCFLWLIYEAEKGIVTEGREINYKSKLQKGTGNILLWRNSKAPVCFSALRMIIMKAEYPCSRCEKVFSGF